MKEFVFQWPYLLLLLAGLFPLARLLARARRKREDLLQQLGETESSHRPTRDWLRLAGLAFLLVALARPGANPERISASTSGRDVVFVLDVSQSMLARDAMPSRLEAAKQAIRDTLDRLHGQRAGLVIYAGSANILCPLTRDYDFLRYMIEQATPRSVDFGGTLLISAVEKAADQVLSEERSGFHDLIVLTDGEDHGPGIERVAETIREAGAGLLIAGIGDPERGARIPIENDEGETAWLEFEDQPVLTRLDSNALRQLAAKVPEARYLEAGTMPFDLGQTYLEFSEEKPSGVENKEESIVIYQELAPWLLLPGLVLLLLASQPGILSTIRIPGRLTPATAALALLLLPGIVESIEESSFESTFQSALALQKEGKTSEALESYELLLGEFPDPGPPRQAALQFNRALCYLDRIRSGDPVPARESLALARQAQDAFLQAARLHPEQQLAARRLDETATLISAFEKEVEEQQRQESEMQKKLEDLVKRLEELLLAQTGLRERVTRHPRNVQDSAAEKFPVEQSALHETGEQIATDMAKIDKDLSGANTDGAAMESVLQRPLTLMGEANQSLGQAAENLKEQQNWPAGIREQNLAIRKLEEILALLSDPGDPDEGEGDEGDYEDEDWEDYEETDAGESQSSSMQGRGDFASGSEMQPLPAPNYSVDDILGEETENQQFRQQKRAAANAAKVKKDW